MVTDGHNGFLLPVENHRLLAKKLKTLIENPSLVKALGSNSRKTFLDKFSIQQMASATEEFINDIIKSKT
jgi:glycosyltransferase involved in cell wall biosynthesis